MGGTCPLCLLALTSMNEGLYARSFCHILVDTLSHGLLVEYYERRAHFYSFSFDLDAMLICYVDIKLC